MKRLKTVLLIALTLTIACGEYVMAESERYWAGHQATLSDSELSDQIHIRYSGDGKTYFARHEKGFEGSGKVDANGRLEKQDIHLKWAITGHVTEPLIVYTGAYFGQDYSLEDVVLVQLLAARKSPEAAQKAVAEKPNSPSKGDVPVSAQEPGIGRYWAGHSANLDDWGGNTLNIKYSEDGMTYSVVWSYFGGASGIGECSGVVDGVGILETVECTPSQKNYSRSIGGTVLEVELLEYDGGSPAGPWSNDDLDRKKRQIKKLRQEEDKKAAFAQRAQAKASAEKKRPALAKAGTEKKRRALAAVRAKAAAEKKHRSSEIAARKRQEKMLAVSNSDEARTFLKDFKEFVSKEPTVFDSFKMAELYGPAQEVASKGQYGSKKKTFQKLVEFANSNKKYRAYRVNKQLKRKRDTESRKKPIVEDIEQLLVLLRKKVTADPLNPIASKVIRIVRTYEKKSLKAKKLNALVTILSDLSSEMRAIGIEPPVGESSISNTSPRGKITEIVTPGFRSIPQLRGIKENDIVFLANLNSSAPHSYRGLGGAIKFEKSTIVVCAPKIKQWGRQALIFAQYKISSLYPNHGISFGSCKGKIESVDAIMARGVDLAKSKELPSEVAFAEGFRTKKLRLIFTVKSMDVRDEVKRRTILSSQYKNDILEGARSGFGAISGNNKSSVGCVIVSDRRNAHQNFVDQASEAREFQLGITTRKNVDVSLSVAFRQLQKKTCGLIYAGEKSLKRIIEASKNADMKIEVLPIWTSASKVAKQAAILLNKQNTSEQSKADRLATLKQKLVEDEKQRAARAAELSQQQARYRTTYGAKVTSLVAAIDTQIKSMRSQIDKTLSNKGSVSAAVKRQSFWGELPGWYGTKRQKGWEFGSTVATPADYGTATWKGRNIEAIVAKVRFLMKQPDLGEYSDTCWYVGYLADAEFSRNREPFVASCKKPNALKKWFVVNRFKTQWDLGVR